MLKAIIGGLIWAFAMWIIIKFSELEVNTNED